MRVVGFRVEELREQNGVKRERLADLLLTHVGTIGRLERGGILNLPTPYIYLIAVAIGAQPEEIVDMDGEAKISDEELTRAGQTIRSEYKDLWLNPNQERTLAWVMAYERRQREGDFA